MKFAVFGSLLASVVFAVAVGVADKTDSNEGKVADERVAKLFATMRDGQYEDSFPAPFPELEWKDVPALIEIGRSNRELKTFPRITISSRYEATCPEGIVALWLVEGIRQGGKYPSLNALCLSVDVEGSNWTQQSAKNQDRLLKCYEDWWKQAGPTTPQAAAKVDPLKDSKLVWH